MGLLLRLSSSSCVPRPFLPCGRPGSAAESMLQGLLTRLCRSQDYRMLFVSHAGSDGIIDINIMVGLCCKCSAERPDQMLSKCTVRDHDGCGSKPGGSTLVQRVFTPS